MKIAFFDTKPYDKESFDSALSLFGSDAPEIKYFETKLNLDTADLCRGFDGVCVFVNDRLDKPVIEKLNSLGIKLISLRCAGFNNVDLRSADALNIEVLRVPAYSPYAVAEHTMALLLTSIRRIHKAYIRTKDFNFSLSGLTGFDLHGKTVGIIGTGKIGRVFADICRGFGMRVLAYDKYPDSSLEESGKLSYVSLDKVFEESDIISLHCPLLEDTYHIIDESALKKCRRGVVILNTSRGALVDTEALLSAIKAREVGAACLDVYEEEADFFFEDFSGHIVEDDTLARLISMPNVIVTSHQAFLTREALTNIAETTIQNIAGFFKEGCSENSVLRH